MDSEPSTSMDADKNITAKVDGWTKSLKYVPRFSYEKLEKHLVMDDQKRKYRNGTSPEKIKPKRLCCLRT